MPIETLKNICETKTINKGFGTTKIIKVKMKILLLTDIPPTKSLTAGIFLENMLRHLPEDSVVCYTVLNRQLSPKVSDNLKGMPIMITPKPLEDWGVRKFGSSLLSFSMELVISTLQIPKIVNDIVKFGRLHDVDRIWATLQGQTMIRLALPVAKKLQIPLYSQVYDSPTWWMKANKVNSIISRNVINIFGKTLRESRKCALASWAMVDQYRLLYGTRGIPMVSCLDTDLARQPAKEYSSKRDLIICMAGQLYASAEWHVLLKALDNLDWKINDKLVKIRYMGEWLSIGGNKPRHIEYLGWRSPEEIIEIASTSDICYCPYWFDPDFELEAKSSFPSKLPLYFASGRPVLFHGPNYSSPAKFVQSHDAAYVCETLDSSMVKNKLIEIASDIYTYRRIAENAHKAFMENLTDLQMKQRVRDFLQVPIQ